MSKKKEVTIEDKLKEILVPKEEQPYEIPNNWEWTKIFGLYKVGSSKRVLKQEWKSKGIPFYRTREIVKLSNEGHVDNELFISEEMYNEYKKVYGVPLIGDLLISGVGTIGIPFLIENDSKFYFKDGNVLWFSNKGHSNSKFIYLLYKTLFMKSQLLQLSKGSTVDTYTIINAKNTKIPLPPLEEQERIVKKIDSMLGRINEAKELILQAKETFENRRASILNLAFSGELTKKWRESNSVESSKILLEDLNKEKIRLWEEECEKALEEGKKKPLKPKLLSVEEMAIPKEEQPYEIPDNWEWVKLGSIANKITDGSHNPPKSKGIGIPMLSAKNIKNDNLDFSNIDRLITEEEFLKENNRTNINVGDILLTIVGTIGRTCEVKQTFPRFALQRSVAVISTYINNSYLKLVLNSKYLKDSMMSKAKGTAQLGIYLNSLKELNIPLPPLEEQKEIVRILDSVLEKEDKVNEILEMEEMIELLEKSILDKAFRGELGTGNLEDVPSLEVLKNILEK